MLKERTPELDEIETLVESAGFSDFELSRDDHPLMGDK